MAALPGLVVLFIPVTVQRVMGVTILRRLGGMIVRSLGMLGGLAMLYASGAQGQVLR